MAERLQTIQADPASDAWGNKQILFKEKQLFEVISKGEIPEIKKHFTY